jgi:PAS domain S-box-containing protein
MKAIRQFSISAFESIQSLHDYMIRKRSSVLVLDNETEKIIHVNDIMTEVFGYNYEEALQLRLEEISSGKIPYTAQNFKKILKHTRTKGEFNFEWQNKRKGGEKFWTANTSELVILNGRELLVILSHDIHSRKIKQLLLQNTIVERTREHWSSEIRRNR